MDTSLETARSRCSLLNPSRQYLINTSGIERVPVWSAGRGWGQRGGGDKKRKKQTGRTLYLAVELSPSVSLSWIIIVWQCVSCRAEVAGMHCSPQLPSPASISNRQSCKLLCCGVAWHEEHALLRRHIISAADRRGQVRKCGGRDFSDQNGYKKQ